MKKLLSIILASVMLASMPCAGADLDYSALTDSELQSIVESARNELFSRKLREENGNLTICDIDGIQMALTGGMNYSGGYLRFDLTAINNSSKTISVLGETGYLNGWEVYCDFDVYELAPGKKIRDTLTFKLDDAGLKSLDEIEDITFTCYLYDSVAYEKIVDLPEIQVFIDNGKVISVQEVFDIG